MARGFYSHDNSQDIAQHHIILLEMQIFLIEFTETVLVYLSQSRVLLRWSYFYLIITTKLVEQLLY